MTTPQGQTGRARVGAGGRSYTVHGMQYRPGVSGSINTPVARVSTIAITQNTLWSSMSFADEKVQTNTSFAHRIHQPQIETNTGVATHVVNYTLGVDYWEAALGAKADIPLLDVTAVGAVVTKNGVSDIPVTSTGFVPGAPLKANPGGALEEITQILSYTPGHLLVNELVTNAAAVNLPVEQPDMWKIANSLLPVGFEDDMPRLTVEKVVSGKWGKLFPSVLVEKTEVSLSKGLPKVMHTLYGTGTSTTIAGPLPAPIVTDLTATPGAAGNVDVGAHDYTVTFVNANGETTGSAHVTATVLTSAKHVALANIPIGPDSTTGRNIYRSLAGTTTPLKLLTAIADNTTTTYDDNTADGSLGIATPPVSNTTSGLTAYAPSTQDEARALSPFSSIGMKIAVTGDPEGTGTPTFRGTIGVTDAKLTYDNALIKEEVLGNPTMQATPGDDRALTINFNEDETDHNETVWNQMIKGDVGTAFHALYFKNYGTKASPVNHMIAFRAPFNKFLDPKMTDDVGKIVEYQHTLVGLVQRGNDQDLLEVFITK